MFGLTGKLKARIASLETENRNFTNAVLTAAADAVETSAAETIATANVEMASGFIGRAFASAEVEAPDVIKRALTPSCLAMIGRGLTRTGEAIFEIAVRDGELRLYPLHAVTMEGGEDPETWQYTVNSAGPTTTSIRKKVSAERILHLRHSQDPETHWRGIGPIESALISGKLSANTAKALRDIMTTPTGAFVSTPKDGNDPTLAGLKKDMRDGKGDLLLVEGGDWNSAGTATAEWSVKPFGPMPTQPSVELQQTISAEIIGACGLPPVLFNPSAAGPGMREAYRQALFGTIAPLGRMVCGEIEAKLDGPCRFDWAELRAADIVSRARGFQSMVQSGMEITQAAALSGLMVPSDD